MYQKNIIFVESEMQIDTDNFQVELPNLLKTIQMADFVAFDCEFTGLVSQLQRIEGTFPDHIEFYERIKETAQNFRIIQLGLTPFVFQKGKYKPYPYNIYVQPITFTKGWNNVVTCEVESMEFLAKNGMDFQRVFKKGIRYSRLFEECQIKEHEYGNLNPQKFNSECMFFSKEDKETVNEIQLNVIPLLKDGKDAKVDFKVKCVFTYFRNKYPELIFDKAKNMSRFQYAIKIYLSKQTNDEMVFDANQEKVQVAQVGTISDKVEVALEKVKPLTFESILETIIKSKKPIVGHFPSLDLGLIYHNFLAELPDSFQEFCCKMNESFPYIFDTKVLSRKLQNQMKSLKVDLKSLYKACFSKKLLEPYSNIHLSEESSEYEKGNNQHQAGYDSLITGCAFIGMSNYITTKTKSRIEFEELHKFNKMIYSRFTRQVCLIPPMHCENSEIFSKTIVISPKKKKEINWAEIGQALSDYGNLSVYEDHGETYFVFEDSVNTEMLLQKFQHFGLKPYHQRRIIKANSIYRPINQ